MKKTPEEEKQEIEELEASLKELSQEHTELESQYEQLLRKHDLKTQIKEKKGAIRELKKKMSLSYKVFNKIKRDLTNPKTRELIKKTLKATRKELFG